MMNAKISYSYSIGRRTRLMLTILVILLVSPPIVWAETLEQQLHRLEAEVHELRGALSQQQQNTVPAKTTPVTTKPPPALQPPQSGAYIRYYIQNRPLGIQPPGKDSALASGHFSVPARLSFDPGAYDLANSGLFSNYRDPSEYAYVGLDLQADLSITEKGEYEFVVYPQPARNGGTNIRTRLSLRLSIGKKQVMSFQNDSSWHPQRSHILLTPGRYRLHLWAVASSDGFGPSPTESRLRLALKGPHDISPQPLHGLQVPDKD